VVDLGGQKPLTKGNKIIVCEHFEELFHSRLAAGACSYPEGGSIMLTTLVMDGNLFLVPRYF
jgi:hypothetical protein